MKQRLAFIDQVLTEAGLHQDIVTCEVLPWVRRLELERAEKVKAMKNSIFTFFTPPDTDGAIVILRHDPPRRLSDGQVIRSQTHMLQWHMSSGDMSPGQWIRGKKVLKMSDLSHDGRYFIYGLQVAHNHSMVVLSRPPYFTGLTVMEDLDDFSMYDLYPGSKRVGGVWLTEENAKLFTDQPLGEGSLGPLPHAVGTLLLVSYPLTEFDDSHHYFTLPSLTCNRVTGGYPEGVHYVPHTRSYQEARRAADREARKTELLKLKNAELREMCQAKALRTVGVKAELVNRLLKDESAKDKAVSITPCSQRIEMRQGMPPCMIRGWAVSIVDGQLVVEGQKMHNFLDDVFYCLKPPPNYQGP